MSRVTVPLAIRTLRADDLDRIFDSRSRQHGERWLARQARSEVYVAVAELDGVPVGRVGLDFDRAEDERSANLWAAHVEPEFQSRGIGTALMLHVEEIAAARGCTVIHLGVGKANPRAHALYERLGYAIVGEEVSRWTYRDGDRVVEMAEDCWSMEKHLDPPPRVPA